MDWAINGLQHVVFRVWSSEGIGGSQFRATEAWASIAEFKLECFQYIRSRETGACDKVAAAEACEPPEP